MWVLGRTCPISTTNRALTRGFSLILGLGSKATIGVVFEEPNLQVLNAAELSNWFAKSPTQDPDV